MKEMRGHLAAVFRAGSSWRCAALALALAALAAAPAQANVGYELNTTTPSLALPGQLPHGIAVDQANHRIYVAVVSNDGLSASPGEIARYESNLSAAGTFSAGTAPLYSGVAVNPLTHDFYAAQSRAKTPLGTLGTPRMELFSASGTPGTPWVVSDTGVLPQIATDSAGRVYFPNAATDTVQVFNAAGVLQEAIGCGGCTGGAFGKPASVALDSDDNLYVVDLSPNRVVKLTRSGGTYSFDSLLQNGGAAAAVGVDPSADDVLVGVLPNGRNYHLIAYNSSGTKFDDFGAGFFVDPPQGEFGATLAVQIAADATTHRLYVGDAERLYLFDRVTTHPPTATTDPATPVGQLTATLRATVNAKGHTLLDCEFEYVDDAEFLANQFANAAGVPCPQPPVGASNVAIEAKAAGLAPETTYHYRVKAASYAGGVDGNERTFTTLPVVAATITAEAPVSVTQTSAKLKGVVNPHGGSVSDCHFEYGTSLSYGTNLLCSSPPGAVTTDVAQARDASGLQAGTTYHYRLVVTSNAGTVKGDDVAFTTASPPPPPPLDEGPTIVTPPPVVTPPSTTPPTRPALRCKKGFRKKRVRGKVRCVRKHRKR